MVSDLIIESLKASEGLIIGFYTTKNFYYEGQVLACDGIILKYRDRKTGVRLIPVSEIKEVFIR